jgi:3-phenylpropionate/trans-cinnamate dioxygenase ferredoxin subunit
VTGGGWTEVARRGDIPPGEARPFVVDERQIAVVNLDGEFHAIDNLCTHAWVLLTGGRVVDGQIECPIHHARFDIRSGAVTWPPAYEPIAIHEVRLDGDAVLVRLR